MGFQRLLANRSLRGVPKNHQRASHAHKTGAKLCQSSPAVELETLALGFTRVSSRLYRGIRPRTGQGRILMNTIGPRRTYRCPQAYPAWSEEWGCHRHREMTMTPRARQTQRRVVRTFNPKIQIDDRMNRLSSLIIALAGRHQQGSLICCMVSSKWSKTRLASLRWIIPSNRRQPLDRAQRLFTMEHCKMCVVGGRERRIELGSPRQA